MFLKEAEVRERLKIYTAAGLTYMRNLTSRHSVLRRLHKWIWSAQEII